jgi:diadenosine tetraphosphatase ApaH/serine/threonine PP2A family protein phosphatase
MLAVLSDIHGNLAALERVVADAEARGCTRFVNLGDILSGPLWPKETAEYLMARDWPTIGGNHERQLLTLEPGRMNLSDRYTMACLEEGQLAWLNSLPPTLQWDDQVFLCHGTPASDLHYYLHRVEVWGVREATVEEVEESSNDRTDRLILCGHTHLPRIVRRPSGGMVANPGSVGLPAYDDDHPYPHAVETGSPDARYAIWDGESLQLIALAYDHEAAARQAELNNRSDWAHALRYGRVGEASIPAQ